jgi:uncharacterized protein (DUF58 family)
MTPLAKYLDPRVIQQVSRLDLRARFIVEGFLSGLHASPFHGRSPEFSEHRKYAHGDDPRHVDWRVFARTDRLFIRRHEAETSLACHLIVDASASMGPVGEPGRAAGQGELTKFGYAVHLAAALGYLLHRQRDAVGLGIVADRLSRFLPARARPAHLSALLAALDATVPAGDTGLAAGLHAALTLIPHRGLVVVLSDLLTETDTVLEALHHVRFKGHDLIVMHVLDAAEVAFPFDGPVRLSDPESGEMLTVDAGALQRRYAALLADWREQLRIRIAGLQADYVPISTREPFDRALVEFLIRRARRR